MPWCQQEIVCVLFLHISYCRIVVTVLLRGALSHAAPSVKVACGTCRLQPRTLSVSVALCGGITTAKKSTGPETERWRGRRGVGRGQEDKMWTVDETEIQSDKKQERRTQTQSWRVGERANSGRGERENTVIQQHDSCGFLIHESKSFSDFKKISDMSCCLLVWYYLFQTSCSFGRRFYR